MTNHAQDNRYLSVILYLFIWCGIIIIYVGAITSDVSPASAFLLTVECFVFSLGYKKTFQISTCSF